MRVIFSTLPEEGQYGSWVTPGIIEPPEVRHIPLGLLSLATNSWDLCHPRIIDPFSDHWNIQQTIDAIEADRPDCIGFSCITRRTYALYELLKRTRARWKICGGPHCTYHAQELLEHGADTVFVGSLCEREFNKWVKNPVKGIIQCNTPINEISYPRRRLIDYQHYWFHGGKVMFEANNRMTMFTSVGCPNSCNFCSVQTHKVNFKMPEICISEMWDMKEMGCGSLHIMDDNFNINKNHINGVLDQMENSGWNTEWSFRGQVRFDLSVVPRMKKLGLKRVHVGIEALDDNILKWFNKHHRVSDIENFCSVMRENDVDLVAYFIIGTPVESEEYLKALPEKIKKLGISHPYMNLMYPMPDTKFYDDTYKSNADFWGEYFKNPVPDYQIPVPPPEKAMRLAEQIIKGAM